jgi:UDP-glucose 4-epimerase
VAQSERVRSKLGWQSRYDDLSTIVRDALDWERDLMGRQTRPAGAGRKAAN